MWTLCSYHWLTIVGLARACPSYLYLFTWPFINTEFHCKLHISSCCYWCTHWRLPFYPSGVSIVLLMLRICWLRRLANQFGCSHQLAHNFVWAQTRCYQYTYSIGKLICATTIYAKPHTFGNNFVQVRQKYNIVHYYCYFNL